VTRKRQGHISLDEAAGATRPRIATSKRTAATGADRAIVAAVAKEAAGCEDVLEWTTVNADFKYTAIKGILQSIIVAEDQSRIFEVINRDRRRVEVLIADRIGIVDPHGIWRRVGRRSRISGIGSLPEYAIGIDRVDRGPPGRQCRRSYIVEVLN